MSDAACELYVYYRVARRDLDTALRIVTQIHARLREQYPTLCARVLRRADDALPDTITLMEIYRAVGGIDDALEQRIDGMATETNPLRVGDRHVERFVPVHD